MVGRWSFHGIACFGAVIVLTMSAMMTVNDWGQVVFPGASFPMPESCLTRRLTGMPCPGCGMTRSFIHLSHGRFAEAVAINAAGPLVYTVVILMIPWHGWQLWRMKNGRPPFDSLWTLTVPLAVVVWLIVCWVG